MTTKHGFKKRVRDYAEEHAINYTSAQTIVSGAADSVEILREHVKNHDKIEEHSVSYMKQREIELVASYIPLLDKLEDERWLLETGQGFIVLSLMENDEPIVTAGAFQDGFPQTDDAFELNTPLKTMDGCNIGVESWSEALLNAMDVDVMDIDGSVRVEKVGNMAMIDVANVRAAKTEWTDTLAAVLNEIAATV